MTIFFYGANAFELRRQLHQMADAYLAKNSGAMGLERLDGTQVTLPGLSASLHAAPFLTNSRFVIVEDLLSNKSLSSALPGVLARIPASTVAVFVEREPDQRTAGFKALKAADKVVKFDQLTGPRLLAWVKAEVAALEGSIDHAVARELVERVGEDQWRLISEIEKLVAYDPAISSQTVQLMVFQTVERSIFDLVEAMTAGRVAGALEGYRSLLDQKESEIYVLTMIQWQLRNLLLLKLAPGAMSPAEVATAAGISSFVASKAAAVAARLSDRQLSVAFQDAVDCEYKIKTGQIKPEIGVEQLIIRTATSLGSAIA